MTSDLREHDDVNYNGDKAHIIARIMVQIYEQAIRGTWQGKNNSRKSTRVFRHDVRFLNETKSKNRHVQVHEENV